ncbi:hypothetical protein P9112_014226 [Eukaryota sp. TZLM1-RC]
MSESDSDLIGSFLHQTQTTDVNQQPIDHGAVPTSSKTGDQPMISYRQSPTPFTSEIYPPKHQSSNFVKYFPKLVSPKGEPLGCAYVKFNTADDAQVALDQLQGTKFHGKPCRLSFSQGSAKESCNDIIGNLFIKNLPPDVSSSDLGDMFSSFGSVIRSKVVVDDRHQSQGYGYVHLQGEQAPQKAIEHLDGKEVVIDEDSNSRCTLSVKKFVPPVKRYRVVGEVPSINNVLFKNLPMSLSENEFKTIASGGSRTIQSCMLKVDRKANKKFGFIRFGSMNEAVEAIKRLNETYLDCQQINVTVFQQNDLSKSLKKKKPSREIPDLKEIQLNADCNLWIYNLPLTFTDELLEELVCPYGTVSAAVLMKTFAGDSRKFGFVTFESAEEARAACYNLNGKVIANADQPLQVWLFGSVNESLTQLNFIKKDSLDYKKKFLDALRSLEDESSRFEAMGNCLFPLVEFRCSDFADQITGMILALSWEEIEKCYLDSTFLDQVIEDAVQAIDPNTSSSPLRWFQGADPAQNNVRRGSTGEVFLHGVRNSGSHSGASRLR